MHNVAEAFSRQYVSTLVVEWIEIVNENFDTSTPLSPPSWWSGLKSTVRVMAVNLSMSPPSWWSGLKSVLTVIKIIPDTVSTLVVEWIEIKSDPTLMAIPPTSPPSWWSGLKFRGSLIAVHIIASPLSRRSKLKIRQLQNYIQLPTPLPFSQTPQSLLNCKKRLGKTNSVQQKRWGKPHPFHNLVRMYKECILPLSLPCPNLFKPRHQHLSAGFQNDPSLFSCGA